MFTRLYALYFSAPTLSGFSFDFVLVLKQRIKTVTVEVDIVDSPELASRFGVTSIPSFYSEFRLLSVHCYTLHTLPLPDFSRYYPTYRYRSD